MMNTVKALLIDPEKKSVSEVVLQPENDCYLKSMYELIGCSCVTVVYNIGKLVKNITFGMSINL